MTSENMKRGDIVIVKLPKTNSHIICGDRPCVVVSNNDGNRNSQTITVVPLTAQQKRPLPTHVTISGYGLDKTSTALAEQVCTIDKAQILSKISHIDDANIMKEISKCLSKQLDAA